VDPERDGQRIDNLLLRELKGVPRSRIYSMLRRGEVRVDGRRVRPGARLEAGQSVRLPPVRTGETADSPAPSAALAQTLFDSILFEDDDLLVVAKPSGLAVHGGSGVRLGLVEALRQLRPELRFLELVHRIDRDTSGCVLLAKRRRALTALHDALRERRACKRYLALVHGRWPGKLRRLEAPLERVLAANGERFVRVSVQGKPALSHVQVLRRFETATLLEVRPETGRTHQIRVHLAHAGHPILGDPKYALGEAREASATLAVPRLCLHAAGIEVPDWREDGAGSVLSFEAPLPDDLRMLLDRLQSGPADAATGQADPG
jgi:23S rRNA pseudouridine955/2504/2580 synthase